MVLLLWSARSTCSSPSSPRGLDVPASGRIRTSWAVSSLEHLRLRRMTEIFSGGVTRLRSPQSHNAVITLANSRAIDNLWRLHVDELRRFAVLLVGPTDSEDVVSSAFLSCARHVGSRPVENWRAYLFRAVANEAFDHRHRRRRRHELVAVASTDDQSAGAVDVRRGIAQLSSRQRAVIYFAYWEDLTEQQIAVLLAISPGSVRRHMFRAKETLRKGLL